MTRQSFNHGWEFQLGEPTHRSLDPKADGNWQAVVLPHDWSIGLPRAAAEPSGVSNGFFPMGRGYYRKSLTVPEAWRGKQVYLLFEGVYMNAEVSLNEHFITRHPYGYTSFKVDLTPYLKYGEANNLRVMVDNAAQTNSRWYSGSGIYRPVWLYVTEALSIDPWGIFITTPEVSAENARVRVEAEIVNAGDQDQAVDLAFVIDGPDQAQCAQQVLSGLVKAGSRETFACDMNVSSPQRWSPETPVLYSLETHLHSGEKEIDSHSTAFGIRTIAFDAQRGFLLNDQPVLLKGGCVHHDNGIIGAASFERAEERKVALHKASGYNAIRTAHNPPSPAFLDACDRLGMMVMDEAFDCWQQGKNPYDYHTVFPDWWQRDMESMVRRDRNHPCIVLWSIGNEVHERDGRGNGAQIARALAQEVKRLDPTRPVTSAICGVWDKNRQWEDTDPVFAALDIGGYNYQFKQYQPDHERHPERVMVGCESTAREAFESWYSVVDLPYVIGDFVWTSLDYLGESGIGRVHYDSDKKNVNFLGDFPWHQANCGDLDLCGFKRPQSFYRDILWGRAEPLFIAVQPPPPAGTEAHITYWGWPDVQSSWTWPGREGQVMQVEVYSACEEVELLLNGESMGRKPARKTERHTAAFEVSYQPGVVEVIGYTNNSEVARSSLRTCTAPARIQLTAEQNQLRAENDLCYVQAQIVDENNALHPAADRPLFFTVTGPAKIFAVGSADPCSTEPYQGNSRSTYRGRCLVVLRSTGEPGEIALRAHADGLQSAEINLVSAA